MLFGLQKLPLFVDWLFLVRCNCLLLPLQLNIANKSFEQCLEDLFLFSDWGIAECSSHFCWGIGQPSFIMAVQQFLWLGIIFILIDFVMQRKICCRWYIELSNEKITLIPLSLDALELLNAFFWIFKSIAVVHKKTFLHFFYFCQLQSLQNHL